MTQRLEKACNILRWAIDHNKSISNAVAVFGVSHKYLREARKDCVNHDGYKEFIKLYNSFKTPSGIKENELVDDDLLPKDTEVNSPYLKFTEEQKNKGVLDARGKSHVRTLDQ